MTDTQRQEPEIIFNSERGGWVQTEHGEYGPTAGQVSESAVEEYIADLLEQLAKAKREAMTESEMGALCYRGYRVSRLHEKFLAVSAERRRLRAQLAEAERKGRDEAELRDIKLNCFLCESGDMPVRRASNWWMHYEQSVWQSCRSAAIYEFRRASASPGLR